MKVDFIVRTHGHDYVRLAMFPEPEADVIDSEYPVPVKAGPACVVNIHSQTITV